MADDLAAMIQRVNAARMKTTRALGRLTPRAARRVVDRLRPEREATNDLVAALMAKIRDTQAFVKWFDPPTRH